MTPEDRQFWLEFRRGILQINLALERLLEVGKYEPAEKSIEYLRTNGNESPARPTTGRRT